MLTSDEIRRQFLDFFKSKDHRVVESAPVVPHGDPTLLFTNAGMNQFKDVFLGTGKRDYTRAADTQKCIRVSGKHNDLEEVGVDTYHHTFFEMLGNWSFGDYYKEEAIAWAWELLTEVWKLPAERLYATVYRSDDEALEIWKRYLPESRIQKFDEKDNFWEMGETGPCGPCSEIHFDGTTDMSGGPLVNAGSPDVIEIWNLVFIQYNRKADGSLEPLPATHVDTGMGFERVVRVLQGKSSNYDTDVFMPLLTEIASLAGKSYKGEMEDKDDIAMRVIADHIRTLSFSIADGAFPGNEGRGYVLRRILRRASRFARSLGFTEPMLYKLLPVLIKSMGDTFGELKTHEELISKVIRGEEEGFLQTLDNGLAIFDGIAAKLGSGGTVSGEDAFLLYDSFGFPLDLTELIAREKGFGVDTAGFAEKMKEQKERSRASRKKVAQDVEMSQIGASSEFTGYDTTECEGRVLFVEDNRIVLDRTPFYSESGGQVSDTGTITLGAEVYEVEDVKKSGDAIVHFCDRAVEPAIGAMALARVDNDRRKDIMKNHSATHLMHEALKRTLGAHLQQQGSLVAPGYLRFDFNHFEKVSESQIREIEEIVNRKIFEDHPVVTQVLSLDEAKADGRIKMYFGDKYGDTVRAVFMDEKYSIELCGGTHVSRTSEIGFFKVMGESSVAAGIRRIEAITGRGTSEYVDSLNTKIRDGKTEAEGLQSEIRKLEKEINRLRTRELGQALEGFIAGAKEVKGIRVVTGRLQADNADQLKDLAEELRNRLKSASVALLASVEEGKVQLVCVATDDIMKEYPAGKLVGEAAKLLGGGGGGKPAMATAGGKDITALPELLEGGFARIVEGSGQ